MEILYKNEYLDKKVTATGLRQLRDFLDTLRPKNRSTAWIFAWVVVLGMWAATTHPKPLPFEDYLPMKCVRIT